MKKQKICLVAGARPNFMKIAPLYKQFMNFKDIFDVIFVHTGQHYDKNMSDNFISQLNLPEPNQFLNIGSASHAVQTARIMMAFEEVIMNEKPDWVVVVGDVNSTIACALVASKLHIPVAHIEAGLRSFDREMPEEINRILTDQISDKLFITSSEAIENLENEGVDSDKVFFVGNLMIESLINHLPQIEKSEVLDELSLNAKQYSLLTLHRPSNVDSKNDFLKIWSAIETISNDIPVVFPVHPRTRNKMNDYGIDIDNLNQIKITPPINYFDFLALQKNASLVFTDSGGIQEETTFFKVPCLTLRNNTERPITVDVGTNKLIGVETDSIIHAAKGILKGNTSEGKVPKYWDKDVSKRIVEVFTKSC